MLPRLTCLILLVAFMGNATAADKSAPPARDRASTAPPPAARADPGIRGLDKAVRRADGAVVIEGRLGGKGEIRDRGHRVIQGTLAPGDSPGCVTDQGNVTFTGSGTLEIELAGTTPCTGHDRLTVAQTLTLQSARLQVLLLPGFTPAAGQRFDILDWGTLAGTFGTLDLPALPAPLQWDTSALCTSGEIAIAGPLASEADIPMPAWSMVLLAIALVGAPMALSRRRGRR
jgi:hypothetical protein